MLDQATLFDVIEHTWPAARRIEHGAWLLREGAGGGKRVSAATARRAVTTQDLAEGETAMRAMGQAPLFMLQPGEEALDALLETRGYGVIDPVNIWACPVAHLTRERPPRTAAFHIWEPMAIQRDIWATGGITAQRVAVMERARGPKIALFGRNDNRPAASGFAAIHNRVAMVHALEVLAQHRRAGMGRYLMAETAFWAAQMGAHHVSVICTRANAAANGLYSSLGMTHVGQYHYRIPKDAHIS